MTKYLDQDGLLYLWTKILGKVPTKTSQLTNDNHFTSSEQVEAKINNHLSQYLKSSDITVITNEEIDGVIAT